MKSYRKYIRRKFNKKKTKKKIGGGLQELLRKREKEKKENARVQQKRDDEYEAIRKLAEEQGKKFLEIADYRKWRAALSEQFNIENEAATKINAASLGLRDRKLSRKLKEQKQEEEQKREKKQEEKYNIHMQIIELIVNEFKLYFSDDNMLNASIDINHALEDDNGAGIGQRSEITLIPESASDNTVYSLQQIYNNLGFYINIENINNISNENRAEIHKLIQDLDELRKKFYYILYDDTDINDKNDKFIHDIVSNLQNIKQSFYNLSLRFKKPKSFLYKFTGRTGGKYLKQLNKSKTKKRVSKFNKKKTKKKIGGGLDEFLTKIRKNQEEEKQKKEEKKKDKVLTQKTNDEYTAILKLVEELDDENFTAEQYNALLELVKERANNYEDMRKIRDYIEKIRERAKEKEKKKKQEKEELNTYLKIFSLNDSIKKHLILYFPINSLLPIPSREDIALKPPNDDIYSIDEIYKNLNINSDYINLSSNNKREIHNLIIDLKNIREEYLPILNNTDMNDAEKRLNELLSKLEDIKDKFYKYSKYSKYSKESNFLSRFTRTGGKYLKQINKNKTKKRVNKYKNRKNKIKYIGGGQLRDITNKLNNLHSFRRKEDYPIIESSRYYESPINSEPYKEELNPYEEYIKERNISLTKIEFMLNKLSQYSIKNEDKRDIDYITTKIKSIINSSYMNHENNIYIKNKEIIKDIIKKLSDFNYKNKEVNLNDILNNILNQLLIFENNNEEIEKSFKSNFD